MNLSKKKATTMSATNSIKNVAIVGATGTLGEPTLAGLLKAGTFQITAITRKDSSAQFPTHANLTVKSGDYTDTSFLASALKGQDALIIILGFAAPHDVQYNLITAAAEANVPFVFPVEYGSDTQDPKVLQAVPMIAAKTQYRQKIVDLGKSSFIALVSNPWTEYGYQLGGWSIDIKNRKATIFDGGKTPFHSTSLGTVALAIVRLLSLPATASEGKPSLETYKNSWVYIRSFKVSQRELLNAAQKATNTTDKDWTIEEKDLNQYVASGHEDLKKGDFSGAVKLIYGSTMQPGVGDVYAGKPLANEVLGLPVEDLDAVVGGFVKTL